MHVDQVVAISLVQPVIDAVTWVWQGVQDTVSGWFKSMFDPARILGTDAWMVSWIMSLVGWVLPGALGSYFTNVGTLLRSAEIRKLIHVGLWLLDPIIDTTILVLGLTAVQAAWGIAITIRFIIWVKGLIWASGA